MDEREWLESNDPQAMLQELQVRLDDDDHRGWRLPSDRKLRLFACALCRRVPRLVAEKRWRWAVEAGERFADGAATGRELHLAWDAAVSHPLEMPLAFAAARCAEDAEHLSLSPGIVSSSLAPDLPLALQASILRCVAGNPFRPVSLPKGPPCERCGGEGTIYHERDTSSDRPCHDCDGKGSERSPWLTPTVVSLAQAAYDERERTCGTCNGSGNGPLISSEGHGTKGRSVFAKCKGCHGTGRIEDGTLDPVRLLVLADALEEAGCAGEACGKCKGEGKTHWQPKNDREDMEFRYMTHAGYRREDWMEKCEACDGKGRLPHPLLAHLRNAGPHWRGCHALDILLGKD